MEMIYKDKELDYTPGHFPKASIKISKKYTCISPEEPRRRAEAVDTIAADNLLEQMNNGGAVPDSVKGGR